jgi:DNA-binding response OmpR family regulator
VPGPSLAGRCILIVEDEPLVALHIIDAVKKAGAVARVTHNLREAEVLIEADDLSAAILDYRVGDGDTSLLAQRLKERGVPFLIYSGYTEFSGACKDAPRLPKPSSDAVLVATLRGLLERSKQ